KIEEQMNDSSISINFDSLSIEHILPQTPTDVYWTTRFTIDDRIKRTNNLGNLSLITVRKNSQAKNYEFITKINVYFKADGKASNLAMVIDLLNYSEWKPENIAERNLRLLNHFLKAVGLVEYQGI
ncbi:MAG: HNH endonuclease family protein, partial [Bacteroidales bacterium]